MSDVQFSEETALPRTSGERKGGMAAWLVRAKWARDEKQAEFLLIGLTVVAFATMLFVFVSGSLPPRSLPPMPLEQTIIPGEGGVPAGYAQ